MRLNNTATIEIGWRDNGIPCDVPLPASSLWKSDALKKGIKHLAIDRGYTYSHRTAFRLIGQIRRISQALPEGQYLQIHTTNQSTAPKLYTERELALELRCIDRDTSMILWDIALHASPTSLQWRLVYGPDKNIFHFCPRTASALIRTVQRKEQERTVAAQLERENRAEQYISSLPAGTQALQRTCRATCIRVSADGRSVTEILHDVCGSMTYTEGINDFAMPDSLADMQARHDEIYHRKA